MMFSPPDMLEESFLLSSPRSSDGADQDIDKTEVISRRPNNGQP